MRVSYIMNEEKRSTHRVLRVRHVRSCWSDRTQNESSDRECSDGLKSRLAARFAKRSDATRSASSSMSFCAVEASMRVPLDSLRTCERKCRRLNAYGRPSFNCLLLVTWTKKKEEKDDVWAHSFESAFHFFLSPPIVSDGQFVLCMHLSLIPLQPKSVFMLFHFFLLTFFSWNRDIVK